MPYIDSHIHLQDYKTEDIKNVINNAIKNKVTGFVNVSAHPADWAKVKELYLSYPIIIPAFGVHPWYINEAVLTWADDLEKMLVALPNAWVGECGIDCLKNPDIKQQTQFFKIQLELARIYQRTLIVHAVKAENILKEMLDLLPAKTIFHSFTGPLEWGIYLQKRGFYLGLNFSIMHKKNSAEIIRALDSNYLLLETDGPYQSGDKNSESLPQNIGQLADFIAQSRHISLAQAEQMLYQNWQRFKENTNG